MKDEGCDVMPVRDWGTMAQRFAEKYEVDEATGCWVWKGCRLKAGYGRIMVTKRHITEAHRVSYEMFVGPIPEGLEIDHLCKNKPCVNPSHLEAVTRRVNNERSTSPSALNALKTHCPQGHLYDEENTVIRRGFRECKTCNRARVRAQRGKV